MDDDRTHAFLSLCALLERWGGLQYATVLRFSETAEGLAGQRVYTTVPDIYPTGASKLLPASPWLDIVHGKAKLFVAADEATIRAAYPDPETVFGLGACRLANMPVMRGTRRLGLLNVAQGPAHEWVRMEEALPEAARIAALLLD
ncbi:hypothetical protein L1787_15480 [Acuticoccus sp. M5D2P5]|uniref:hypothetical protein n=1 Tax=Acuticoccus kalidii TaxID=2910977 RepID=UPI001F22403D|nr:hypothetical protein [Acuticoccus kalidii]MCF3934804.1 hypothetical protein [Acuticoccus kalidii]